MTLFFVRNCRDRLNFFTVLSRSYGAVYVKSLSLLWICYFQENEVSILGSRIMHYCITVQLAEKLKINSEFLHLGGLAPDAIGSNDQSKDDIKRKANSPL